MLHNWITKLQAKWEAERYSVDWIKVKGYFSRRGYTESYAELITGETLPEFSKLWAEKKDKINEQLTIILVREVENGLSGKEKDIFVRGLLKLPNVWKACLAQEIRNVKIAEAQKAKASRRLIK